MIKMMGLLFIIAFCSLCGIRLSSALTRRTQALKKTQLFLHLLRERLSYTLCPVDELFLQLSQEPLLEELDFIPLCSQKLSQRLPFPQALEESLEECRCALSGRDRAVLEELCTIVGGTEVENQLAGLELVRLNLAGQTAQAQQEVDRRARLYASLGVLAGLAIAIVLL